MNHFAKINLTTNRTVCLGKLTASFEKDYSEKAFTGNFRFPIRGCFGSAEKRTVEAFLFSLMSSKLQSRIGKEIRSQFADYSIIENHRPKWLCTPENERLELDFYISELKLAFEIQGAQHYSFIPHFHKTAEDFNSQLRRDGQKRELCRQHGISLIEVASLDDYTLAQPQIKSVLDKYVQQQLEQYILQRVAQQIINTISLKEKIKITEKAIKNENSKNVRVRLEKQLSKHKANLERDSEIMRYVSLIAIQEFHGLRERKIKGKENYSNWKRRKREAQLSGTLSKQWRGKTWV